MVPHFSRFGKNAGLERGVLSYGRHEVLVVSCRSHRNAHVVDGSGKISFVARSDIGRANEEVVVRSGIRREARGIRHRRAEFLAVEE